MHHTGADHPKLWYTCFYMNRWDNTALGGANTTFPSTRWSVIVSAKTDNKTRRQLFIGDLAQTYWKPVYCFVRKQGYSNDDAKELTQQFFCDVVLGGRILEKADRRIGSFRGLLIVALKRFLINADTWKHRKKRCPEAAVLSFDPAERVDLKVFSPMATPEQAFYHQWIADLLDGVLLEIREEYCDGSRSTYWQVFKHRVLAPIMEGGKPPSLSEMCASLGIKDESQVSNMIVTVKRRFRSILKRRLRALVTSDAEAEYEFQEIVRFLSEDSAG